MTDLSVIICAHNPYVSYLMRTIEALRAQTLPLERWEFLLVDNASKEPLASAYDLSWHPHARHIAESKLGLAPARRRGMCEARAEILVFLDDDNIVSPDYLAEVVRISHQYSSLGTFGSGAIIGEFEVPPPAHLKQYLRYLALREVHETHLSRDAMSKEAKPWGAGLCVRAEVAAAYCQSCADATIAISGRHGQDLLGGEDDEISIVACNMGFQIGIFPELKLIHLIPERKITDQYLIRIREGLALTDLLLAYKWQGVRPGYPYAPRALLGLGKCLLLRKGIDRQMYLAYRRASAKARRIIAQSRSRIGI